MVKILLNCKNCEQEFSLEKKEYNRQNKKGREHFFCGLPCSSSFRMKNLPTETRKEWAKKAGISNLGNTYGKKGDFTYYLNKSKHRNRGFDLDEEYLKSIWSGNCALSNIPITIKTAKSKLSLSSGSLDRIDSSKGYIKGNVQFVAYGLNLAKNNFTDDELKSFISLIKNH
jgi:hypothetical protein